MGGKIRCLRSSERGKQADIEFVRCLLCLFVYIFSAVCLVKVFKVYYNHWLSPTHSSGMTIGMVV